MKKPRQYTPGRHDEPIVCFVCKRAATGIGIGKFGNRMGWACESLECQSLLPRAFMMPTRDLSTLEGVSLADAGDAAGQYLEGLGKTDLGDLSPTEWARFLKIILTTYESKMREHLAPKAE